MSWQVGSRSHARPCSPRPSPRDGRFVSSRRRALQTAAAGFCRTAFPLQGSPPHLDQRQVDIFTTSARLAIRLTDKKTQALCRRRALHLHMSRRRALHHSFHGTWSALPPLRQQHWREGVSPAFAATGRGRALTTCADWAVAQCAQQQHHAQACGNNCTLLDELLISQRFLNMKHNIGHYNNMQWQAKGSASKPRPHAGEGLCI